MIQTLDKSKIKFSATATLVENNAGYCSQILTSACEAWQIQFNPTITGSTRLNLWHRSQPGVYLTEYCLGHHPLHVTLIGKLLIKYLEMLDHDISPHALEVLLPQHTVLVDESGFHRLARPITRDPQLITQLCALADVPSSPIIKLICGEAAQ